MAVERDIGDPASAFILTAARGRTMPVRSPSGKYAAQDQDAEVGATSGQRHVDVLTRTLGREDGLATATGVSYQKPLIVPDPRPRSLEASGTKAEVGAEKSEPSTK